MIILAKILVAIYLMSIASEYYMIGKDDHSMTLDGWALSAVVDIMAIIIIGKFIGWW